MKMAQWIRSHTFDIIQKLLICKLLIGFEMYMQQDITLGSVLSKTKHVFVYLQVTTQEKSQFLWVGTHVPTVDTPTL